MRLIDADKLPITNTYALVDSKDVKPNEITFAPLACVLKSDIDNALTIEERPTGEWEYVGLGIYECTNCKAEYEAGITEHCNINNPEFKYCPNCGADMRGNEI